MRLIFLLLAVGFLFYLKPTSAQENHQCKIYRSIFEYRDNDTLNDYCFTVVEKQIGDITMFGGTDFDISFPDRKAAKKFRKQYVWGAYKDSLFFLNNRRFSKTPGFNLVEYHGYRYFLLMATVSKGEAESVTYQHSRHEIINGAIYEVPVIIGIAYDIIEDKFYFLYGFGVQELLKDKYSELLEYNMLEDKKDYQSIFRIIEKMDREEYNNLQ